jgi:hypothetical protein
MQEGFIDHGALQARVTGCSPPRRQHLTFATSAGHCGEGHVVGDDRRHGPTPKRPAERTMWFAGHVDSEIIRIATGCW